MPFPKTPHHPRIILDCDGTLYSTCDGRKNQALLEALQFLKIKNVAMGTAYDLSLIVSAVHTQDSRDRHIQWLTDNHITMDYVAISDSDIFDQTQALGSYYAGTVHPLEQNLQKMYQETPDLFWNEGSNPNITLLARQQEHAVQIQKNTLITALEALEKSEISDEKKTTQTTKKDAAIAELIKLAKKEPILIPALFDDNGQFIGDKEIMLHHILREDKDASAFIMVDDKQKVIDTATRINQGDKHPDAKGKLHGVHANMNDPSHDRNYYIRHLMLGYKPTHLLALATEFGIRLPGNLKAKLEDARDNPDKYTPEQLQLLARLVLMCINPTDMQNVAETAVEIQQKVHTEPWHYLYQEMLATNKNQDAAISALQDNLNQIDLSALLTFLHQQKFDDPQMRDNIENDLLEILEKSTKRFSAENYLAYVKNLDALAAKFRKKDHQNRFKTLMRVKFAKNFALHYSLLHHIQALLPLHTHLSAMRDYCKKNEWDEKPVILELIVRLHLTQHDLKNANNIEAIIQLLSTLDVEHMTYVRTHAYAFLTENVFKNIENNNSLTDELLKKLVNPKQHNDNQIYAVCKQRLDASHESTALREVLDNLLQQEKDNQQDKNTFLRTKAIHLTHLALGAFHVNAIEVLLRKTGNFKEDLVSPDVFAAISVLAKRNPTKALAVLKVILAKSQDQFDRHQAVKLHTATYQEIFTSLCERKDNSTEQHSSASVIALAQTMSLLLNPVDLKTGFRLSCTLTSGEKDIKLKFTEQFFDKIRTLAQTEFKNNMANFVNADIESYAHTALAFLEQHMAQEKDENKKYGLHLVCSGARDILNDKTRSDAARTLAAEVVLRTAQLISDPTDEANKTQLQTLQQAKQHRMELGEKILRGVAIVLSAMTGVGLAFAIPFGLSSYKKHQKSTLLETTEALANNNIRAP
jgi:hypothetical protein